MRFDLIVLSARLPGCFYFEFIDKSRIGLV